MEKNYNQLSLEERIMIFVEQIVPSMTERVISVERPTGARTVMG